MCTPVTLRPLSAVVLVIHAAGVGCPLPAVGTRGRLTVGAQDSQLSIPTPLALPVTVRVRFGRVCEVGGWFVFMAGWPCLSWQGMEYLAALERLSVYRIRISSLAEVFRLHCLTELAEVHFRLHPVVESESDYRLFVVRLLPRLRQLRRPAALWASLGAARWVSRVLGVTALLTFWKGKLISSSHRRAAWKVAGSPFLAATDGCWATGTGVGWLCFLAVPGALFPGLVSWASSQAQLDTWVQPDFTSTWEDTGEKFIVPRPPQVTGTGV